MTQRRHHRTQLVHAKKKQVEGVRNEINVTPLVDVCLVLLIIFMVVAPELTRGMEVNLPKAHHFNEKSDTGEQLIVSLVRDGAQVKIYFGRDYMPSTNELRKRVQEELSRHPQQIYMKADANLKFGQVYPALIATYEAGSPGVQLGTAEAKDQEK